MGGDMTVAGFVKPEAMSMENFKTKLLANVDLLTSEDEDAIKEFYYNTTGDSQNDVSIDLEKTKQEFREIIEEAVVRSNYRDVTIFFHKGDEIYLTGGISWGDGPTDSYDVFEKFSFLPEIVTQVG